MNPQEAGTAVHVKKQFPFRMEEKSRVMVA
jgi:hypothetical protein